MKAFLEPYYGGSHKDFADGFIRNFPEEIVLFTLPGRHWKWRMHGSAVSFAEMIINSNIEFDTIIATSLIDLALLRSLILVKLPKCRYIIYFHENQLAYPWSQNDKDPTERKDLHYGFINFTSALTADRVIFNSHYNMNSFFDALGPFLKAFPDENLDSNISNLLNKSKVIYPGIETVPQFERKENEVPVILWNHRWEYDKNPDEFFHALFELKKKGIKFKLAVAGEERVRAPEIFNIAKEKLKDEIISWGYLENRQQYLDLIKQCDILPVTSKHEFFGISVLEAASAGVVPILPKRLSYPELFPFSDFSHFFYKEGQLSELIGYSLQNPAIFDRSEIMKRAGRFSWAESIKRFESICDGRYQLS